MLEDTWIDAFFKPMVERMINACLREIMAESIQSSDDQPSVKPVQLLSARFSFKDVKKGLLSVLRWSTIQSQGIRCRKFFGWSFQWRIFISYTHILFQTGLANPGRQYQRFPSSGMLEGETGFENCFWSRLRKAFDKRNNCFNSFYLRRWWNDRRYSWNNVLLVIISHWSVLKSSVSWKTMIVNVKSPKSTWSFERLFFRSELSFFFSSIDGIPSTKDCLETTFQDHFNQLELEVMKQLEDRANNVRR